MVFKKSTNDKEFHLDEYKIENSNSVIYTIKSKKKKKKKKKNF